MFEFVSYFPILRSLRSSQPFLEIHSWKTFFTSSSPNGSHTEKREKRWEKTQLQIPSCSVCVEKTYVKKLLSTTAFVKRWSSNTVKINTQSSIKYEMYCKLFMLFYFVIFFRWFFLFFGCASIREKRSEENGISSLGFFFHRKNINSFIFNFFCSRFHSIFCRSLFKFSFYLYSYRSVSLCFSFCFVSCARSAHFLVCVSTWIYVFMGNAFRMRLLLFFSFVLFIAHN